MSYEKTDRVNEKFYKSFFLSKEWSKHNFYNFVQDDKKFKPQSINFIILNIISLLVSIFLWVIYSITKHHIIEYNFDD